MKYSSEVHTITLSYVGWFSNNDEISIEINFSNEGNLLNILASTGSLLQGYRPLHEKVHLLPRSSSRNCHTHRVRYECICL